VILANFSDERRQVRFEGLPGEGRLLRLNADNLAAAARDPVQLTTSAGDLTAWTDADPLTLRPFELVRLDFAGSDLG
jgi:hypothetical protein